MSQLFSNNARSTLSASISAADTALVIQTAHADLFPVANTGAAPVSPAADWFKVVLQDAAGDVEIVYVRTRTAGSGTMSNLLRGQEGTTARTFISGSVVGLRITAADMEKTVRAPELLQNSAPQWLTGVTGTDAITASLTPAITSYVAGQTFRFVAAGANTGPVTININGLGVRNISKATPSGMVALNAGDITQNAVYQIVFDGTQFQVSGGGGGGARVLLYENRADLRAINGPVNGQTVVEGLGYFVWHAGSTEPDDDESCFATTNGRWLLEAAHWDVVSTWQAVDDAVRDEDDEDELLRFNTRFLASFDARFPTSFNARFAARLLFGTANCNITSVGTVATASFTGTVAGAAPGDRVVVTPPAEIGASTIETARLAYHARITAPNIVTVTLTNASASSATINVAARTSWLVTVIKP